MNAHRAHSGIKSSDTPRSDKRRAAVGHPMVGAEGGGEKSAEIRGGKAEGGGDESREGEKVEGNSRYESFDRAEDKVEETKECRSPLPFRGPAQNWKQLSNFRGNDEGWKKNGGYRRLRASGLRRRGEEEEEERGEAGVGQEGEGGRRGGGRGGRRGGGIQLGDPATRKLRLPGPKPLRDLINADVTSYDHPAKL
ncbi:hypothetical protein KM043_014898 [Ampulex compressa]|nr:hypothetical protein KM043_014898 [Ampulex compressa]